LLSGPFSLSHVPIIMNVEVHLCTTQYTVLLTKKKTRTNHNSWYTPNNQLLIRISVQVFPPVILCYKHKTVRKTYLQLLTSQTVFTLKPPQINTYAVVRKEERTQRRAKVAPLCSCCGWQKGMSQNEMTSSSEKIKPVALCIVELHFAEGIS